MLQVACSPLQYYLDLLGVSSLTFLSLDVEGAEEHVVNSIDWKKTTVTIHRAHTQCPPPSVH